MKVLLTGASGYIGGSVADGLLKRGDKVVGLVRSREKADAVEKLGIQPLIGTLDDADLLRNAAADADAVVNAADSDHQGAIEAMLDGLEGSGKPFVHTSGSSVISDTANGEASEAIFNEDTPVIATDDKAPRLAIDNLVRNAATRQIRSAVICNTMIYGHGLGVHRDSIQVPSLIRQARSSGTARHVGQGLNRWSTIHVSDMVALYLAAIDHAPAGLFVFAESGEVQFRDITSTIAETWNLGGPDDWSIAEATEEWGREYAIYALGSNSRVRSKYASRVLAWEPSHSGVLDWIRTEAG